MFSIGLGGVGHFLLFTRYVVQFESLIEHRRSYLSCQSFQTNQTHEVEGQCVPLRQSRFDLHQAAHSKLSQVPVSAVKRWETLLSKAGTYTTSDIRGRPFEHGT